MQLKSVGPQEVLKRLDEAKIFTMRQDGEPHNNLKIIATTEEKLGERMKGNTLLQLQKRCENIVAVIIDEYSMVPGI